VCEGLRIRNRMPILSESSCEWLHGGLWCQPWHRCWGGNSGLYQWTWCISLGVSPDAVHLCPGLSRSRADCLLGQALAWARPKYNLWCLPEHWAEMCLLHQSIWQTECLLRKTSSRLRTGFRENLWRLKVSPGSRLYPAQATLMDQKCIARRMGSPQQR